MSRLRWLTSTWARRVQSRLAGKPVGSWHIGDTVRLVVGAMYPDSSDWQAFWFEPDHRS